jgi:hypothetical protein
VKPKHTPGPWRVQDNTIGTNEVGHQLRVDSNDGAVADCGRSPHVDEQSRANARLIAAAPTLLKAVKLALMELERISYQKRADQKIIDLLNKAVAKATGGAK